MIRNYTAEALAGLQAGFGDRWQCWWVPRAIDGSLTWHARRHGERAVIHAASPDELAVAIECEEG